LAITGAGRRKLSAESLSAKAVSMIVVFGLIMAPAVVGAVVVRAFLGKQAA
jgi:hypothetical protein